VQYGYVELLRCRRDQQIGDLAPALASLGEQALHLKCSEEMRRGRVDAIERVERSHESIPLLGVSGRVAHLEVADAGTTELTRRRQRLDHRAYLGVSEAFERARVE